MKKIIKITTILSIITILSCSCSNHRKNLYLIIDNSSSVRTEEMIDYTKRCIGNLQLDGYNSITVDIITDSPRITNALREKIYSIDNTVSFGNSLVTNGKLRKIKADIQDYYIKTINELPVSGKTSIIDTIWLVSNSINLGQQNTIVIISDMVEESDSINMIKIGFNRISMLKYINAQSETPALTNVNVWILGTLMGKYSNRNTGYYKVVQKFWIDYLHKLGCIIDERHFITNTLYIR